jgi:uncharacterized protein RhaS with RHS repeats
MKMNKVNSSRISYFLAGAIASVLGYTSPAFADTATYLFPAGIACNGFDLRLDLSLDGNAKTIVKKDKNGSVRTIVAGTGSSIRYTNLSTGKTISTKSNGATTKTTVNPDGTSISQSTGHNLLILFPTDVPPGPSTTLYDGGRIVYSIDANGNFTLKEESGRKIDICAALS